jgi:non-specific protein-tyrosine kinase
VAAGERALATTTVQGLRVLPAGAPGDDAASLVTSPRMAELLAGLRGLADVVLIDSPALLDAADAAVLATCADEVIMVVDGTRTTTRALGAAQNVLARTTVMPARVVVNKAVQRYEV